MQQRRLIMLLNIFSISTYILHLLYQMRSGLPKTMSAAELWCVETRKFAQLLHGVKEKHNSIVNKLSTQRNELRQESRLIRILVYNYRKNSPDHLQCHQRHRSHRARVEEYNCESAQLPRQLGTHANRNDRYPRCVYPNWLGRDSN